MLKSLQTPAASTRISLLVNVLLFIAKIIGGVVGRSQALVADALNSLLDIVANIVVWLGIRIASKPPDKDHPYGHGNADNLAAVFVALVLFVTGGYIGREALHSIINKEFTQPTYLATIVAAGTIIIKEALYRYTIAVGRKFKSPGVIANAYDHRSDVLVSLGTLIGIVVAQTKYPILDPIAGLWVAFFIIKQAVRIIRENLSTLMVSSPGGKFNAEIKKYIEKIGDVSSVKWIKSRKVGSGYYVDAAVRVRSDITVREGHDIATQVTIAVRGQFEDVMGILVHIEPEEENHGD